MLLSGVGLLGGCQKIFGEFEIVEEPPPPPPPTTLCVAGDLRCVGPYLYSCSAGEDSWSYRETCVTELHCNSRAGGCQTCVPGEYRCEGTALEVCGEGGWTLAEDCGDSNACNLNSDSCRPCTPMEYQCQGKSLLLCSNESVWTEVAECSSQATCSVTPDKSSGACAAVDPRCTTPLMHVCDDGQLLRCNESLDQLVVIDNCPRPELCDAAAADRQAQDQKLATCLVACTPDAIRCAGAEFQRCTAVGVWEALMGCDSPAACSAKLGTTGCSACTPGTLECNDGELRRCAPDSPNGWELVQDCGAAALCNEAAGQCDAAGCPAPGQTRCEDGLEKCLPDQSEFDTIDYCDGDLCNANDAKCDTRACDEHEKRCWEGALQECDDSLRSWDTLEVCDADESCSLDGCTKSDCQEGEYRCNDVYLETCRAGTWEREERCATHALCDTEDKRCNAPTCDINEYDCAGSSLRRCNSKRTGWDERGDCAGDGLECHEASGSCR